MRKPIVLTSIVITTLLFANCKKEKNIVNPNKGPDSSSLTVMIDTPSLLQHIGGMRCWTGLKTHVGIDSFSMWTNESFEVVNNGNGTIKVDGITLKLQNIDTNERKIKFSYLSNGTMSLRNELEYYYVTDSMTYLDESVIYGVDIVKETKQLHTRSCFTTIDTAQLMSGIGEVRHWTGTYSWQYPGNSGSEIVNDTFEVIVLSNMQISIQNNILSVTQIDTIQNKMKFVRQESAGVTTTWNELDFYYQRDSMSYFRSQNTGLGGSSLYQIHTVE